MPSTFKFFLLCLSIHIFATTITILAQSGLPICPDPLPPDWDPDILCETPPPPPPPPPSITNPPPLDAGEMFLDIVTPPIIESFSTIGDTFHTADAPLPKQGEKVFLVKTPVGEIPILVKPTGSSVKTSAPRVPENITFRPPNIFSAPLPTGSGARALGLSGGFTGLGDDATAASWNPAGLTQLERPEASAVYRFTYTKNQHRSTDPDFEVGENSYDSDGLNYFSLDYPLSEVGFKQNIVLSINVQEAYDFRHQFSARTRNSAQARHLDSNTQTFTDTQRDHFEFEGGTIEVDIESRLTTHSTSTLDQTITTSLESELEFEQQGLIEAFTPSVGMEVVPKVSVGGSLNLYQDSALPGRTIRSITKANYTGMIDSRSKITTTRTTSGTSVSTGVIHVPGLPPFFSGFDLDLPEERDEIPTFGETTVESINQTRIVEGHYTEVNEFDNLNGLNTTLGVMWEAASFLTVGASVDLPWIAEAQQTKTIRTESTTYNADKSQALGTERNETQTQKDVEFEFPLFWAAGAVVHWSQSLYTSIDISQTRWSDFSFKVEGEEKINPFDGTPHGVNPIDNTWTVRVGTEYLWILDHTEIPFRAGFIWEQRPAIGEPDDYYGYSAGTGFSLGKDPNKLLLDIAYTYIEADNVQTIIPDQQGLSTDTEQHQIFVSAIYHF